MLPLADWCRYALISVGAGYPVLLAERVRRETGMGMLPQSVSSPRPSRPSRLCEAGEADLIVMARELLRDPYWPLHAAQRSSRGARYGAVSRGVLNSCQAVCRGSGSGLIWPLRHPGCVFRLKAESYDVCALAPLAPLARWGAWWHPAVSSAPEGESCDAWHCGTLISRIPNPEPRAPSPSRIPVPTYSYRSACIGCTREAR